MNDEVEALRDRERLRMIDPLLNGRMRPELEGARRRYGGQ
jgi:hypothetical protein